MSIKLDPVVLEAMASKICHDLISPMSAVNNGIEFLEDGGGGEEITQLIAFSAAQATAKLQAFRLAYGLGGSDSHIRPEDAYKAIDGIITGDGKIKQVWDAHIDLKTDERPKGLCKILSCALLLAIEFLPKGGEIDLEAGSDQTLTVHAKGTNASFKDNIPAALNLSADSATLDPRQVHAYITGALASHYGYKLSLQKNDDHVTITISEL